MATRLINTKHAAPYRDAYVPNRDLLTAHALVHGLIQHRTAPGDYPSFRMLTDLCDLGTARITSAACQNYVVRELPARSLAIVHTLVDGLERGIDPRQLTSSPAHMLAHLVAGAVDHDYQQALFLDRRHALTAVRHRLSRLRAPAALNAGGRGAVATETARVIRRLALSCASYVRLLARRGRPLRV